jgi:hypothetical protein
MENMFNSANIFNQNISSWNVSNITNFKKMFENAHTFNQVWNMSKENDISYMFASVYAFKQNIKI